MGIDTPPPYISVLVIAHNRREYVIEALNSLLSQTLSHKEFEILVLKNFEDEKIDAFIQKEGIK